MEDLEVLMNMIFEECKFPVTAAELKGRISALIEREYLKKDDEDPEYYIYLA